MVHKSLDAVSEHLVKSVKISLLEQAIGFAFNLDRIKASSKRIRASIACNALAWLSTHAREYSAPKGRARHRSIPALPFTFGGRISAKR
jgi:hypothetical protein